MVVVGGMAFLAVLVSAALSLHAARRLAPDARIPVHAGFGGWDRDVSRSRGLWEWPVIVGVTAGIFLFISLGGPAPLPMLVLFALVFSVLLWYQRAAFRHAARGGGLDAASDRRPSVPKWVSFLLIAVAVVPLVGLAAMFLWPRGGPPTTVEVEGDRLVISLRGPYKAFALRSELEVPLDAVVGVRADSRARDLPRGFRVGTSAPGVIAGRFTSSHCRAFWAIDNGSHAVVVDLRGAKFDRIVAEVADPAAVVGAIRAVKASVGEAAVSPCDG